MDWIGVTPTPGRDRTGTCQLTQAIRPAATRGIIPREGYRIQTCTSSEMHVRLNVLTAAVSQERLFETFLALLEPLGSTVDVILESSHRQDCLESEESEREGIDAPILTSHCLEYEELLLNDGCTGIAVLNEERRTEVHFDEHKLIYVYGTRLSQFEQILADSGIRRLDNLPVITEGEHIHCTLPRYSKEFEEFRQRIGAESYAGIWDW